MTPLRHPIAECPVPISSDLFRDRLEYARSVRPRTYLFLRYLWASLFIFIYLVHFSLISHASALSSWAGPACRTSAARSEEHTSELQSRENSVCRLLLE